MSYFWTAEERAILLECIESGRSAAEAAALIGKSMDAVQQYRMNHGLPSFAKSKSTRKWPKQSAPGLHYKSGKPLYNFRDLTGKVFGELRVLKMSIHRSPEKAILWLCQCSCGAKTRVRSCVLNAGRSERCKTCMRKHHARRHDESLVGVFQKCA